MAQGITTRDFDGLSDKALSIFTFAAYHRLLSGERVASVIRRDGAGHEADADGVSELEGRGLVTASETGITFAEAGQDFVETLVGALQREAGR